MTNKTHQETKSHMQIWDPTISKFTNNKWQKIENGCKSNKL